MKHMIQWALLLGSIVPLIAGNIWLLNYIGENWDITGLLVYGTFLLAGVGLWVGYLVKLEEDKKR